MSIKQTAARLVAIAAITGGAFAWSALPATAADNGAPGGGGSFAPADNDWGIAPSQNGGAPGNGGFTPADHDWNVALLQNGGAPGGGG
ncbi:hypothetical protein [Streptomyces sp. NPDC047525]|uniref:hypothetical protein n=1 Tax=Streptomyces sp. NPDC047525 TaxID=3155264 RepID=UPI0033DDDFCA